jgi:probable rRNA maturation factor
LRRVCVQGVLHLCGYKDKTDDEKKEMTFKEDFYLGRYVSRET